MDTQLSTQDWRKERGAISRPYCSGRQTILDSICLLLGQRADQVDWGRWTVQDWASLQGLAEAHGVGPLVFRELQGSGWPDTAPPEVRERLRELYFETAGRNTLWLDDVEQVTGLLAEDGVPVVLLKGGALAVDLYADMALRPMGDADLLVPRNRLAVARKVVEAAGYSPEDPGMAEDLVEMVAYEVNFDLRPGSSTAFRLELHWDLIGGSASIYRPEIEWFWAQVLPAPPGSKLQTAGRLTPTAHLLYLCTHLMLKHAGIDERLLWGYDLHLLVQDQSGLIDWNELVARARQFRWDAALYGALLGIARRFGTPVPAAVLDELEGTVRAEEVNFVRRKAGMTSRWLEAKAYLQTLGWRARVRYVLGLVFPGKRFMCRRYTPRREWTWPLYYFYRWADVAMDGLRALSRVRSSEPTRGRGDASGL